MVVSHVISEIHHVIPAIHVFPELHGRQPCNPGNIFYGYFAMVFNHVIPEIHHTCIFVFLELHG